MSVQTAERQTRAVLATRDRYTGSGWVLSRRLPQLKKSPLSESEGACAAAASYQEMCRLLEDGARVGREVMVIGGLRKCA